MVVGSLLSAPSLPKATLDGCCKLLASMEKHIVLPPVIALVPQHRDFVVDLVCNKLNTKQVKAMFKELDIPWHRLGAKAKNTFLVQIPFHIDAGVKTSKANRIQRTYL